MKKICISKDWKFTSPETGTVDVDLPHDFSVRLPRDRGAPGGAANGFFTGSTGLYEKYIDHPLPSRVWLDIDGAYTCAEVRVNEELLGMHPHGYTPYLLDVSRHLWQGVNKIAVKTVNLQPSTRWYSGAGVYRDVFLWLGGEVAILPRDVFVYTEEASEKEARVKAEIAVTSDIALSATLRATVLWDGTPVATAECTLSLKAGGKTEAALSLTVPSPRLWCPEDPALYELRAEVKSGEETVEEATVRFGIRTVRATVKEGLLLNGRPLKLRGGCIHHDHGALGAAAFPDAERRKVTRLKAAGFNALRIAHNPPSLALLEACDEEGILVMDEAFDMWNESKNALDYHLWFADWWERDIALMVERDRNHPSVISYSIGNEIVERDGISDGNLWAERLAAEVRRYDPTRFVTSGVCGMWWHLEDHAPEAYREKWKEKFPAIGYGTEKRKNGPAAIGDHWGERTEEFFRPLDIAGYNYMFQRYAHDREKYPDRIVWGSETHPIDIYHSWRATLENPNVLGDFTWTAWDNLGEAGTGRGAWARDGEISGISMAPYPWRTCYQGDFDLAGFRRPQSYLREAVWGRGVTRLFTTHPEHYGEGYTGTGWHFWDVLDSWRFEDRYLGKPVLAEVYTDGDEAVFFFDGEEVATVPVSECIARTTVPYTPGTLSVKTYKNGLLHGEDRIETVSSPAALVLSAESEHFPADGRGLCYVDVTVTDKEGRRIPDGNGELFCHVEGGELLCIFSGDPQNEDEYTSPRCHAFRGRAVAILRAREAGEVRVTVTAEGLRPATVTVIAE